MFAYWVCVASIGNLIDYVPIRTFTDGTDLYQDMYAVERGFGLSPWTLLVVFGIPTGLVLGAFLLRIEPRALRWLFPASPARRTLLAVITAFVLFDFYGAAGWAEGGPYLSHNVSHLCVCRGSVGSHPWRRSRQPRTYARFSVIGDARRTVSTCAHKQQEAGNSIFAVPCLSRF